ncbi:hypothetical protein ABZ920_13510 [Streptomyces sp. NPDC046831]|uniref:hypothetical protein n=1 Tax=Streptomyces sp. NPDC046831 TaxID=3154805 RepID=UPI0033C33353
MNHQSRRAPFLPDFAGRAGSELLGIYLNDHLAGATAGVGRARHLVSACRGSAVGEAMAPVADEIARDRRTLLAVMRGLDVPIRRYKVYAGRLGERAGRLKSNGRLVRRSPLSTLLELELLYAGVAGKSRAWQVLRQLAEHDERLDAPQFDALLERARGQLRTIDELHRRQTEETFAHSGST